MKPKDGWDPDYVQLVGVVVTSLRATESCLIEPDETVFIVATDMASSSVENNA